MRVFVADAGTRVVKADLHRRPVCIFSVELGLDKNFSAGRHGLEAVFEEIKQHLLDLVPVSAGLERFRGGLEADMNIEAFCIVSDQV